MQTNVTFVSALPPPNQGRALNNSSCNPWAQSSSRGSAPPVSIAAYLIVCTLYVCLSVCLRVTVCHCPLLQFLAAGAWQGAARCPPCAAAVPTAHTIHPCAQHCRTPCQCQCNCTVIGHSPPRYGRNPEPIQANKLETSWKPGLRTSCELVSN